MNEKTLDVADYIERTAQLLDLSIAPEYLPGVIDNMTRIAAIATLVTEFELPEDLEAAPVFEP
ncbi:MAG: DUF4089 domain-containing protein [Hydrococcus sp. C42_A2020_068]|uniref:DUF4089 domain-containing protein n=1 Tax=Pleurocapsa sp. PCC 7327 TaxID=118163 RepID=UPI00029F95D1|nr:DUF4089 domain-containing protein [Pleurocapsa sp. PCC 7327]AFY77457.1 hypothetical protein Ple7327_2133 [Pleurocapsa sp. PCC 7327]MBF2022478.1 DUF4089 domain-containing protein [Hydrococcus sp. C42_A2020_068]